MLTRIGLGHREQILGRGELEQYEDRLVCAGREFVLAEIENMAVVVADRLVFSYGEEYRQIRAADGANIRKYLAIWKER